jgi:hypothetical protein
MGRLQQQNKLDTFQKWKTQVSMVNSINKKVASLTTNSNSSLPSSASDIKLCSWNFFVYIMACLNIFIGAYCYLLYWKKIKTLLNLIQFWLKSICIQSKQCKFTLANL